MLEIVSFFIMKHFYFKITTDDKKDKIKQSKNLKKILVISQNCIDQIKSEFCCFCFSISKFCYSLNDLGFKFSSVFQPSLEIWREKE